MTFRTLFSFEQTRLQNKPNYLPSVDLSVGLNLDKRQLYIRTENYTVAIVQGKINAFIYPFRLLNLDVDVWVHLNCALWSLEVYETLNGALMNVDVAVKRGNITVRVTSSKKINNKCTK